MLKDLDPECPWWAEDRQEEMEQAFRLEWRRFSCRQTVRETETLPGDRSGMSQDFLKEG
ncbi:MAG: hypothetical protein P8182_10975 [Deltaproteobacteria bacterium]